MYHLLHGFLFIVNGRVFIGSIHYWAPNFAAILLAKPCGHQQSMIDHVCAKWYPTLKDWPIMDIQDHAIYLRLFFLALQELYVGLFFFFYWTTSTIKKGGVVKGGKSTANGHNFLVINERCVYTA